MDIGRCADEYLNSSEGNGARKDVFTIKKMSAKNQSHVFNWEEKSRNLEEKMRRLFDINQQKRMLEKARDRKIAERGSMQSEKRREAIQKIISSLSDVREHVPSEAYASMHSDLCDLFISECEQDK